MTTSYKQALQQENASRNAIIDQATKMIRDAGGRELWCVPGPQKGSELRCFALRRGTMILHFYAGINGFADYSENGGPQWSDYAERIKAMAEPVPSNPVDKWSGRCREYVWNDHAIRHWMSGEVECNTCSVPASVADYIRFMSARNEAGDPVTTMNVNNGGEIALMG